MTTGGSIAFNNYTPSHNSGYVILTTCCGNSIDRSATTNCYGVYSINNTRKTTYPVYDSNYASHDIDFDGTTLST